MRSKINKSSITKSKFIMKKNILIVLLSMVVFTASAQQLSSGDYTVSISNLKTRSYTKQSVVDKSAVDNVEEYKGNYTIKKRGVIVKTQEFSTIQTNKDDLALFITEGDRNGNTLFYDFSTKIFEIAYDEFKAKKTNTSKDIILSGILIYAQWRDQE